MNLEEVLKKLNATLLGDYYTLICPKCGKKEAFLYLDDLYKYKQDSTHKVAIRCNRLNKCGEITYLNDLLNLTEKKELNLPTPKSSIQINNRGIELIEKFINYSLFSINCNYKDFDFDIRGISNETLKNNGIFYYSKKFESIVDSNLGKKCFSDKYRIKEYKNRDIFIPILNYENKVERILLRSKEQGEQKKKEIQLKLKDRSIEIWNIKALINKEKYVFITEGVYDALSIKDVDPNVDALSLPGVRKYKQLVKEIDKNIDKCKNKIFIIATDNDKAGHEYAKKLEMELKNRNLRVSILDLRQYKDVNDFLQKNRLSLILSIKKAKGK